MPDVIQLTIWDRLSLATTNSVGADFLGLLTEVDESIEQLPLNDRLGAAGEAIRRLGEIYAYRSAMQLSQIEYLFHPEREPILPLDAFDCYVRQSMVVDLEQFIEAPALPEYEREYNLTVVRELSVTEALAEIGDEVVSEELEVARVADLVLGIAHGEEIELWASRIRAVMAESGAMLLVELQRQSGLSLVDVWLGLLLGDTGCLLRRQLSCEVEFNVDFYDRQSIWIVELLGEKEDEV
jgi:nucleotide-binding universal stress UspA family protein